MQDKNKTITILLIVAASMIIGWLVFSICTGNFFSLASYYKTPLKAYNESMISNPARSQIGYYGIDDKSGLFIGEIDSDTFIVADMEVKGGRYAHKSFTAFYKPDYKFNPQGWDEIETSSGTVKFIVAYKKADLEKLKCDYTVSEYKTSSGQQIYLAIYK